MPKEIIVGEVIYWDDKALADGDGEERLINVGWGTGHIVQIATSSRASITHDTLHDGFWVNIDRDGINELIRALRKARDRTYGRDE